MKWIIISYKTRIGPPPYTIGVETLIMSKSSIKQITEVGPKSTSDPKKAVEHSIKVTQPIKCVLKSVDKEVKEMT